MILGDSMKHDIINACSDLGVHVNGADEGPIIISKYIDKENVNKIVNIKKKKIVKSTDKNDLRKNEKYINTFNKKLFKEVKKSCKQKRIPIIIGGDHSVAIGSALGSQSVNELLGIIWIDAHSDYNTFETTRTGNIHGLPLAAITGYKCNELTKFFKKEHIDPKKAVIVGARSIDPWEIGNLEDAGVNVYKIEDIKEHGIEKIMRSAIKIASKDTKGIHISYDLDVIDPKTAPGVSVPEKKGITEKQAYEVMEVICKYKNLVRSLDLVEYNPSLDKDEKTKNIAVKLIDMFINK